MREVTEIEVKKRMHFDNPWWEEGKKYASVFPIKRAYFDSFHKLVIQKELNRAVVLMGPRRVGKTVMLRQTIQQLIADGSRSQNILYVSIETPLYTGLRLDQILTLFMEERGPDIAGRIYLMFDEIQYLTGWEVHLKSLVDSFPDIRFVASGSAAAALKLKSRESGAGRFADFLLPPLTFKEFCDFRNVPDPTEQMVLDPEDHIRQLNLEFINYINFGGFPEAVFAMEKGHDFHALIGQDIIDKVLLRDLPGLYGIRDTRELHRLFSVLAYNTGEEVNFEGLSQASGIAKNTIRRYLEYLEAAFLITRLSRIDESARRFKRATHFKVYLTNPSLRAALFGPVDGDDPAMGKLVETAIISQWAQTQRADIVHYARWRGGKAEIDIVVMDPMLLGLVDVIEVKWSDRLVRHPEELRHIVEFVKKNAGGGSKPPNIVVLTRTIARKLSVFGHDVTFLPASWECYLVPKFGSVIDAERDD